MDVLIMVVLNIWHGLIVCNYTELSAEQNSVLLLYVFYNICIKSVIVFWIYLDRRNRFGMCNREHMCYGIKDKNGVFSRQNLNFLKSELEKEPYLNKCPGVY